MKQQTLPQKNPISKRANCKLVRVGDSNYLIGGLTADKVTNDIIQFRIVQQDNKLQIEWKHVPIDKKLFKPRNSFCVCSDSKSIYIWGGLQMNGHEQHCLDDLLELNTQTNKLSSIPVKNPFPIHSSVLVYDHTKNYLIAYGGTNQPTNLQSFLYILDLNNKEQLEWKKIRIQCKEHKGLIWQHSGHFTSRSVFNGEQGRFLVIVGGCNQPFTPYDKIVEINLDTNKVSNITSMKYGLVAQDTILQKDNSLLIFGGSNGGDFNNKIFELCKGQLSIKQGHNCIGCAALQIQQGYLVYGGVNGHQSLSSAILYNRQ